MQTLRITHRQSCLELCFQKDNYQQVESRSFSFNISSQDAEDIRWYLEDYRMNPVAPGSAIARRIKTRIAEIGTSLFQLVLADGPVWQTARPSLPELHVTIESELDEASFPWELLRDPASDLPLALVVSSFVRRPYRQAIQAQIPHLESGKVRILVVICRLERDNVPFRSVAKHMISSLSEAVRKPFRLEVLRPPTFRALATHLRKAKAQREPFHIVHFDGHGSEGEVFFENPNFEDGAERVGAIELSQLLYETCVPLLILNACRSASSEPQEAPQPTDTSDRDTRQFGSLANAVMHYGALGVVAWRYNVYVETAAQFMADLYSGLASGLFFGQAATLARKQLRQHGTEIDYWSVPQIFEAEPIQLFSQTCEPADLGLSTSNSDITLPRPDIGFIGRDETVHRVDRAFDSQTICVLHGYAGSGKTNTAADFARWYRLTSGATHLAFTSFETQKTLDRVLEDFRRVFDQTLLSRKIEWFTLSHAQRRDVSLRLLQEASLLWIWDNIESVFGFPIGTVSAWNASEQAELLDYLQAAQQTKAKFLLTSRREERAWLHDLPARIEMPQCPFKIA